jgi:hypothetical protein
VSNENGIDRLQKEFSSQIHYSKIFVVELTVLLGRVAVAISQVQEHLPVQLADVDQGV